MKVSNKPPSVGQKQLADANDIMLVIPEVDGGVSHVFNMATVPKTLIAEFDKLPPALRREVVAAYLGDQTIATAKAACAAFRGLCANATDEERLTAATVAFDQEKAKWV